MENLQVFGVNRLTGKNGIFPVSGRYAHTFARIPLFFINQKKDFQMTKEELQTYIKNLEYRSSVQKAMELFKDCKKTLDHSSEQFKVGLMGFCPDEELEKERKETMQEMKRLEGVVRETRRFCDSCLSRLHGIE